MREGRRLASVAALRELDVECKLRRAELATLEHARDILERSVSEHPDRCDHYHPGQPCEGVISARWCRRCGVVIRHCEKHGGIRAATYRIDMHLADEHGGSDVLDPETEDARRLSARSEALPVGGVQASPAAGSGEQQTDSEERASDDAPTESSELGSDRGRPSTGPSVIRRRKPGSDVD